MKLANFFGHFYYKAWVLIVNFSKKKKKKQDFSTDIGTYNLKMDQN